MSRKIKQYEAEFLALMREPHLQAVSGWKRPNHAKRVNEQKELAEFRTQLDGWFDLSTKAIKRIKL